VTVLKTGKKSVAKKGRPKGRSSDTRSFGPLGDLLRASRIKLGLGLADMAKACGCSIQFISNIEHGRAPLPWNRINQAAELLEISVFDLQAANLAIRADFGDFMSSGAALWGRARKGRASSAATAMALVVRDAHLREFIEKYQQATPASKKNILKSASPLLNS
jgi:transcriptional regulator with XRE-family HTH domain